MNALLTLFALSLCAGILLIVPEEGGPAILICAAVAGLAALVMRNVRSDKSFLLRLFVGGLLVRIAIGTLIYVLKLQEFFGGDAYTYDFFGYQARALGACFTWLLSFIE